MTKGRQQAQRENRAFRARRRHTWLRSDTERSYDGPSKRHNCLHVSSIGHELPYSRRGTEKFTGAKPPSSTSQPDKVTRRRSLASPAMRLHTCRMMSPAVAFPADIAIVGGGASGVLLAAQLVRKSQLRVVLIERSAHPALGVAYSTRCRGHLLNVRASDMSALADEPDHFVDWLARDGGGLGRTDFVPRADYGRYLEDLLADSVQRSEGRLRSRPTVSRSGLKDSTFSRREQPCWQRAIVPRPSAPVPIAAIHGARTISRTCRTMPRCS